MAVPLLNGKQQFLDAAGVSLGRGTVELYVPGTTTPKTSWQDEEQTQLNTNPISLDAGGYAKIYGSGGYRQIVKDVDGNTIWDQEAWAPDPLPILAAAGGAALIGYEADGGSAQLGTVADYLDQTIYLIDFIPENLRSDIFAGTSSVDLTAYFSQALAFAESLPTGGAIIGPRGILNGNWDFSKKTANDDIKVTLRGQGRGATTFKTVGSGAIGLNAVGRNFLTVEDLTIQSGGSAYCGIVLARNTEVGRCVNNSFRNVEVRGDFSLCAVASCASESTIWDGCLWAPTTATPALIDGHDPAAPLFNLVVPGQTLIASSNTDQHVVDCEAYVEPADGTTVQTDAIRLSGVHAIRFENFTIVATLTEYLVRFTDPTGGRFGANTSFEQHHFEGGTPLKAEFFVNVTPGQAEQLQGLSDLYGTYVGGSSTDVKLFDYAGRQNNAGTTLTVQGSRAVAGRHLNGIQTGFDFYCDVLDSSDIDYSCMGQAGLGPQGAVCVFLQAQNGSKIHAADARVWKLVDSHVTFFAMDAVPTAGVYPQGAIVPNDTAVAGGSPGWIAIHGGSMDTDPGTYTCQTTSGSNVSTMNGDYPMYVGARVFIQDWGEVMIRDIDGRTLYLLNDLSSTGASKSLMFSGATVASPFAALGVAGLTQMSAQADSTAADVAALKTDFNALLAKLRTSALLHS